MYSPGVGTGPSKLDMLTGGAFGEGLDQVSYNDRNRYMRFTVFDLTGSRTFESATISLAPTMSMETQSS